MDLHSPADVYRPFRPHRTGPIPDPGEPTPFPDPEPTPFPDPEPTPFPDPGEPTPVPDPGEPPPFPDPDPLPRAIGAHPLRVFDVPPRAEVSP